MNKINKVLIFTGAGFSVPLGLPISTGFDSIINRCPTELKQLLNNYLGSSINDVEKVTSALEGLLKDPSFLSSILNSKKIAGDGHYLQVTNHLGVLRQQAQSFLLQLKSGLYDLLSNYDRNASNDIYFGLLNQIKNKYSDARISFFTTNYDLTFENTVYQHRNDIREAGYKDIQYGFVSDLGTFAFDKSQQYKWEADIIEYIKIHGSLDWQADDDVVCTKSGSSTKPADPNQAPLLYPGFKEIPSTEPFISFHERLIARLSEASEVLIIGFAFRDPYINSIFEFALRTSGAKFLCFNPTEINKLPVESAIPQFVKKFKHFEYIQKGIQVKTDPLDF